MSLGKLILGKTDIYETGIIDYWVRYSRLPGR